MDDKMKTALLECCEKHAKELTPEVVDFAKDLIETVIKTTDTPIDDMFLPLVEKCFGIVEEYILKQVDKIDGEEGN